jgi:intracellular multiplication protein IcmC
MSPSNRSTKHDITLGKPLILMMFTLSLIYTPALYAAVPDVATMLQNFSHDIPNLMRLVTGGAYVMGVWLLYKGVTGFKVFGEQRSQMSSHAEMKGPLIQVAVGTLLCYLPSSFEVGLTTFFADPTPISYVVDTADQWSIAYQDIFMVVQLIGTVAFIRGLMTLTQLGGQAQPGTFGKGLTYIISGVMCINLEGFLAAIEGTLGITGIGK